MIHWPTKQTCTQTKLFSDSNGGVIPCNGWSKHQVFCRHKPTCSAQRNVSQRLWTTHGQTLRLFEFEFKFLTLVGQGCINTLQSPIAYAGCRPQPKHKHLSRHPVSSQRHISPSMSWFHFLIAYWLVVSNGFQWFLRKNVFVIGEHHPEYVWTSEISNH